MESISGPLSRRMLERYSHIRIVAKKKVFEELDLRRIQVIESEQAESTIQ